jgi:tRNA nucleotidyltransferase/poly(A) polymerase
LTPGSRGLLLDPTNGLADIERRELRILHHQGFLQDPVRLLRLVRFSIRLGFRPEPRTAELFEAALEAGAQDSLSAEALRREAEGIAREANPVAVLKALAERELLAVLHPQLQKRRPDYDGLAKLQKYVLQAQAAGYSLDPFYPVLHYLLGRLKAGARHAVLRRLRLSTAEQKQALSLEKEAAKLVKLLRSHRRAGPRQIYHLLTPIPMELLIFTLATYSHQKKVQSKIYNYLFKYRPLRQKLPVRELHLLGIPAGPKFDQILEKFFEAQLDGKIRGRVQESAYLRKLAGIAPPPKQKPKKKEAARLAVARRKQEPAGAAAAVPKPAPAAVPAAAGKTMAAPAKAAAAREKRKAKLRSLLEKRPHRAGSERRRGR